MPPKIRFSKEDIIKAAMEVLEEEGWRALTAARISKKLDCSVQPLYRAFKSLHEIKDAVVDRMYQLSTEYTLRKYSENTMENIMLGGVLFARDHPKLQAAAMHIGPEYSGKATQSHLDTFQMLVDDPCYKGVHINRLSILYQHAMFYVHGYCSLFAAGYYLDLSETELVKFVKEGVKLLSSVTDESFQYDKSIRFRIQTYIDE